MRVCRQALALALAALLALVGCAAPQDVVDTSQFAFAQESASTYDASAATSIPLDGESEVEITDAGTYVLSGTMTGQVVVDADDAQVQLVLSDAHVTCDDSAALRVKGAACVTATCAEGTANTLATSGAFDDGKVDAAVFSKANLVINGAGSLEISSPENGITGRKAVALAADKLAIEADQHGVWADEGVAVLGGAYDFAVGHDGFHVEGDSDAAAVAYVADGSLSIACAGDGFDTAGSMQMNAGALSIDAGDQGLEIDGDLLVRSGCDVRISATNEDVLVLGDRVGV